MKTTMNGFSALVTLGLAMIVAATGCSQLTDPNVPRSIQRVLEPELSGEYFLYVPSGYDRELDWPLVVVCHGSAPDSPLRQLRAWTELAESHGFLVMAPALTVTKRGGSRKVENFHARLAADEGDIMAAIQHVRGGHSISGNRVFVYGWGGGANAALHVGMRHADIFRAIALGRPKCRTEFLTDAGSAIDHNQPVYVNYSLSDFVSGRHSRKCIDWLYSIGADVREDAAGPVRKTDCVRTVGFYEELIRKEPWVFIRAYPTVAANPLELQFKLHSSIQPRQYVWDFGDGDGSQVAEPIHTFAALGEYSIAVTLGGPDDTELRRTLRLRIP